MSLGSIVVRLTMNTADFETDSARAAKVAEKRSKEMEASFRKAGVAIGLALGAAITGLTVMTKNAIDNADALRDLSIRTGESTELLSAYGYAASQTGTDVETLAKGLKVLSKNAADALNPTSEQSKVFAALGIEVKDTSGNLRKLGDLIPDIADRFKMMEDGTTKAALAQALFGKAGLELTEFLNQGSAGLGEFTEKAKALGIVVDGQTAAAADNFNDTLGDLKALSEGYALHLAKELLPDLQQLARGFTDTATEGGKVAEMAADTADVLREVGSVISFVGTSFNVAGKSIAAFVGLLVAAKKAASGDFRGAAALAAESVAGVAKAVGGEYPAAPGSQFANVQGHASTVPAGGIDTAAIARALSNPTVGKTGLSEAEKAAKKLNDQYADLIASQQREIALFGETREAARVRYDTEFGALAGLSEAKKQQLIENAEWQDQLADTAALEGVWADAHDEAVQGMIDSWSKAKDEMSVYAEEAGRNMQDAFADFLFDPFADGLDGMLKGFGDILRRMAAEMIASHVFEAIGAWGKSNSGADGWQGALASFVSGFGGQRAGGGGVDGSKLYEVGEGGRPEMFEQNGHTYLIPGNNGRVVPATNSSFGAPPAGSGDGPRVEINVDNRSNAQVTQGSASFNEFGKLIINMTIAEVDRRIATRGSTGKAIEGRYGVQPVGVTRG